MNKNIVPIVGVVLAGIIAALAIILVVGLSDTSSAQPGAITYGRVVQIQHFEGELSERVEIAEEELNRLYNTYTPEAYEEEENYAGIIAVEETELEWAEEEVSKLEIQGATEPGYTEAEKEYKETPPVETETETGASEEGELPGYEGYGELS